LRFDFRVGSKRVAKKLEYLVWPGVEKKDFVGLDDGTCGFSMPFLSSSLSFVISLSRQRNRYDPKHTRHDLDIGKHQEKKKK